jgi:hypothetical protein
MLLGTNIQDPLSSTIMRIWILLDHQTRTKNSCIEPQFILTFQNLASANHQQKVTTRRGRWLGG